MEKKIARIPVEWSMRAVLHIPYVHAEELAMLLENVNLPQGKMIPGSYRLDYEAMHMVNIHGIIDDINTALEELENAGSHS